MIIRKAYQFKLKPTVQQERVLAQMSGCCRFLWNKALAMNLERLKENHKLMWYHELSYWLTFWKKTEELQFLKSCHSQPLQQTLKHLDRAFKDAFDKSQPLKKLPTFKKKFQGDSFCYPQGFKFENRRVFLPKIGWIGFRKSRKILGKHKNLTVNRKADGWYISVQVEIEQPHVQHPSNSTVGIDLGIARFATLSNGEYYLPIHSTRQEEKRLAKAQKNLSRKTKFSNQWKKQQQKIGKIHRKIRNRRIDFLHKLSSKISKNHAIIFLEDLAVTEMSKSVQGLGKRKSNLNKAILDQGWSIFKTLLSYKQSWMGGEVLTVDPRYTSQKCPTCSTIDQSNRVTQSDFTCQRCGYQQNADLVGAMNILAAGLVVMACQANSIRSRQQEPVRNRKKVLPQGH